jgi:TetR/AcrR family transcriptional repressor of nem operon
VRVSREQAEKNRAHVVEVAGAQFRAHGFDGIGVADLMQAAGLTHGGFYNNFASKDALAVEAVGHVFAESIARMREQALSSDDPLRAAVEHYLSPEHRDAPALGCAIAALSQDAARGSPELHRAFEAGVGAYLDLIAELAHVPRTVADPALSDEILASATASLLGKKESA